MEGNGSRRPPRWSGHPEAGLGLARSGTRRRLRPPAAGPRPRGPGNPGPGSGVRIHEVPPREEAIARAVLFVAAVAAVVVGIGLGDRRDVPPGPRPIVVTSTSPGGDAIPPTTGPRKFLFERVKHGAPAPGPPYRFGRRWDSEAGDPAAHPAAGITAAGSDPVPPSKMAVSG